MGEARAIWGTAHVRGLSADDPRPRLSRHNRYLSPVRSKAPFSPRPGPTHPVTPVRSLEESRFLHMAKARVESKTGLITTLVLFVLTTLGLGIYAYTLQSDVAAQAGES